MLIYGGLTKDGADDTLWSLNLTALRWNKVTGYACVTRCLWTRCLTNAGCRLALFWYILCYHYQANQNVIQANRSAIQANLHLSDTVQDVVVFNEGVYNNKKSVRLDLNCS